MLSIPAGTLLHWMPLLPTPRGAPPHPEGGLWAGEHHPELPHGGKIISIHCPGVRPGEWAQAPRRETQQMQVLVGGMPDPPLQSLSIPMAGVRGAFPERKPARMGFLYSINIQRGQGGGAVGGAEPSCCGWWG